jgi:hypothetical protein
MRLFLQRCAGQVDLEAHSEQVFGEARFINRCIFFRTTARPFFRVVVMSVNVVYIMGYGHSGSTMLDILLSNHPNIEGVGELKNLHRAGWTPDETRVCACGARIHRCPYWCEVRRQWANIVGDDDVGRYIYLQNRYEGFHHCWPRLVSDSRKQFPVFMEYARKTSALYEAIARVSRKSVVVDSSKDPMRAYALLKNGGLGISLIHLVRDGRGVVWSMMKPRERDVTAGIPRGRLPHPAWRTTVGWIVANLESEWVLSQADAQGVLRIRYEELVGKPEKILVRLGNLLDEDFTPLSEKVTSGHQMNIGHTVSGNRLRVSSSVRLRPDLEWMEKLPVRAQKMFWCLAGWLAKRYGYGWGRQLRQTCNCGPATTT